MRVIAGKFRRTVLDEVGELTTRETKDRVKESIFNSISSYLYDANCLDLFGGSGSLGIEALSREARFVEFVDNNKMAIKTIKSNIDKLQIHDQTNVVELDYRRYLKNCNKQFDIIFLDPPYALDVIDDIIKIIQDKKILHEDGIIICLYDKNNSLKEDNFGIIEYKQKKIGITKVSYMKWSN